MRNRKLLLLTAFGGGLIVIGLVCFKQWHGRPPEILHQTDSSIESGTRSQFRTTTGSSNSSIRARQQRDGIPSDLKVRLSILSTQGVERIGLELALAVKAVDVPYLIECYKSKTNLLEKRPYAQALSFIGGDETADALIYTLTREFSGKDLSPFDTPLGKGEECVMENLVYDLGFLAQRSDRAWEFACAGIDPLVWKTNSEWRSANLLDTCGILAGTCIKAIAISGRSEAENLLRSLRSKSLKNTADPDANARTLDGALVDAAFYLWLNKRLGKDGLMRWFLGSEAVSDYETPDSQWAQWKRSEDGKEWKAWYRSRNPLPGN